MQDKQQTIQNLEKLAREARVNLLKLCHKAGALHIGGDLSMIDVMIALYNYGMKHDPKNPDWEGRDKFVLSKGHGAGAMYIAQAMAGYYTIERVMETYDQLDSPFGIHPSDKIPGVEISTGSLGHGLSICVGLALGARLNNKSNRAFTLMGDGELHEGMVWEAAMAANQFELGNLVAFIDRNRISLDGHTEELMKLEPLADKWRAFGWNVIVIDGHSMKEIVGVFDALPPVDSKTPTVIIANTVKGKGVACMEDDVNWHAGSIDEKLLEQSCSIIMGGE